MAAPAADAAKRAPSQNVLRLPSAESGGRRTVNPPSIPRVCPKGTKGVWPNCVGIGPRKCPVNTTGKWPNCKSIVRHCPEGTTGKWPNCKRIARYCPEGTTGKWPNCKIEAGRELRGQGIDRKLAQLPQAGASALSRWDDRRMAELQRDRQGRRRNLSVRSCSQRQAMRRGDHRRFERWRATRGHDREARRYFARNRRAHG